MNEPSPCPWCGLGGGFHEDYPHHRDQTGYHANALGHGLLRAVIPRDKIKEKGWHLNG